MEYTFKKKITNKYYDNRVELLEWNDGTQIYQKVIVYAKGKRIGRTFLYGISPVEKGGCYDMNSVYKACRYDTKLLWNN